MTWYIMDTRTYLVTAINKGIFQIGRTVAADISLADPNISREHIKLVSTADGCLYLFEVSRGNMTWLNGHRVQPRDLVPLKNDDIILLANPHLNPPYEYRVFKTPSSEF